MPRGKQAPHRVAQPDPVYHNELLAKFVNFIMKDGKKTTAQDIVYGALDIVSEKKKDNPLAMFERAIDAVRPQVEIRTRRVGGANYQVPMPVPAERQSALAFRWITTAAKARKGRSMREKLAGELMDVLEGAGGAIKKKEDVHRMAEANRAFAHFARFRSKRKK